jgi:hypothetical protein
MDIEFEGKYDRKLYFRALMATSVPSRRNFVTRVYITLALVVVAAIYFAVAWFRRNDPAFTAPYSGRSLFIFIMALYFLVQPFFSRFLSAWRLWRDPVVRGVRKGTVSAEGISYTFLDPPVHLAWNRFARAHQADDAITLFTPNKLVAVFPRAFFKSDDDWRAFGRLVSLGVPETAK